MRVQDSVTHASGTGRDLSRTQLYSLILTWENQTIVYTITPQTDLHLGEPDDCLHNHVADDPSNQAYWQQVKAASAETTQPRRPRRPPRPPQHQHHAFSPQPPQRTRHVGRGPPPCCCRVWRHFRRWWSRDEEATLRGHGDGGGRRDRDPVLPHRAPRRRHRGPQLRRRRRQPSARRSRRGARERQDPQRRRCRRGR